MWVRGLKLVDTCLYLGSLLVAPHVGAWIETCRLATYQCLPLSHPMWVRGLKRVLDEKGSLPSGRTPCGCVD